jgi:hypothetical protein
MSEEIKEITYKKLSQIERFVGPDIEDAPDDCSPGSTFFEAQEGSDVGRLYVFDGTRWAEKQQRVTGITLEGENINIVDPETLGKEATLQILKAELAAIKSAQTDGSQKVTLSGTIMELYGATIDERPPANSVPVGATYMAVNTQDVWQSNGTDWVVM